MEEYEEAIDLSEQEWTRYSGLRVLSQYDIVRETIEIVEGLDGQLIELY
jgi:hypothetical protein